MTSRAVGAQSDRDLAKLAINSTDWDTAFLITKYRVGTIHATRLELEQAIVTSLHHSEPKLDGSLSRGVKDALLTIGGKVRPDFSPEQATVWITSMVKALSDLPANVARLACERAVHEPFHFPGDVEAKVREFAEERMVQLRIAAHRLRIMEEELHRAAHPQPKLEDRFTVHEDGPVLTTAKVQDMQRRGGLSAAAISLGRTLGYVHEDQLLPLDEAPLPDATDVFPDEDHRSK